jgi:SusD family.
MIEPALYDLYNNNDLRKVACFSKNNTTGIIRFKGSYSGNSGNHFTGLAAGEIYLIRAECYARRDKKDEALKDLNDMLRPKYKTGTFVNFSAATSEDALKLILTERRKELLLRGLRWSDLRRLNRDNRFKVTLTRVVGNKTYSLEPNSYKYTFPIPDDIIAISGIQQNPGWDK